MKGYLLLPPSPVHAYRGVDRNPFQPAVLPEEMDPRARLSDHEPRIWKLYPPGWRRDAYHVYEDNVVEGSEEDLLYLLSSATAAREVRRIIEPHLGSHEIVACELSNLESEPQAASTAELGFLGFDVAYPGGDFYSAILNGLFIHPDPRLVHDYGPLLNQHGLFEAADLIAEYVRRFRQAAASEVTSEFVIYRLSAWR
jgi:hypothetical protein